MERINDWTAEYIFKHWPGVFATLLADRNTGKNIIWATQSYSHLGIGYLETDEISPETLFSNKSLTLLTGSEKTLALRTERAKASAEVFTPSWMCNLQNSLIDDEWFGRTNVFNTPIEKGWLSSDKIAFQNSQEMIDYIVEPRLEIACGEAPYLASRYDVVSGIEIPIKDRIGFLDRKLRVISENTSTPEEWKKYGFQAIKSVYGFDVQGDNVVLARINLFLDFLEHFHSRFPDEEIEDCMQDLAHIISWNIFQMDGLKGVVPFSCHPEQPAQMLLFESEEQELCDCPGCSEGGFSNHNGIYCRVFDWKNNNAIRFIDLMKERLS